MQFILQGDYINSWLHLRDIYPFAQNLDPEIDSNGLFTHFRQVNSHLLRSDFLPIVLSSSDRLSGNSHLSLHFSFVTVSQCESHAQ